MQTHANKSRDSRGVAVADRSAASKQAGNSVVMLADNSPESLQLEKLQLMADNSPQAANVARLQAMADGSPHEKEADRGTQAVKIVVAPQIAVIDQTGIPVQKQDGDYQDGGYKDGGSKAVGSKAGGNSSELEREEESKPSTSTYAEVSEWIHIALDGAGLTPALGVFPDAVNAVYYLIEGDWVNAGISTLAMAPVFGQGAIAAKYGVKVTKKAAERLGKEGIEQGLKKAVRKEAAEKATKEAGVRLTKVSRELFERFEKIRDLYPKIQITPNQGWWVGPYEELITFREKLKKIDKKKYIDYLFNYPQGRATPEAHHIIEARFADMLSLNSAAMPAVLIPQRLHQQFYTGFLNQALPSRGGPFTLSKIRKAYEVVYKDTPELLAIARKTLKGGKK